MLTMLTYWTPHWLRSADTTHLTSWSQNQQAYSNAGSPTDVTINMESAPAQTAHLAVQQQPITCLTEV